MEKPTDIDVKYQKLATEYSKVRNNYSLNIVNNRFYL